jgi:hypothetical protein
MKRMLNEYKYNGLNREVASEKWSSPIVETLSQGGITLDSANPRHARKLAWMSTLNESVSSRSAGRSILNESGYGTITPSNMYGMGAISLSNPTTSGNSQTTASADKGSGDYLKNLTVASMHIAVSTIAFELLPVIPVEVPMVQMTFVESVYGQAKISDADASPSYISVPLAFFQAQNGDATNFGGVAVANGEFVKLNKGQVYFIAGNGANADELDTDLALKLRFVGQHHITGAYHFQVISVVTVTDAATGAYTNNGEVVADFLTNQATAANGLLVSADLVADTTMEFADTKTVVLVGTAPAVDVVNTKESPIYGASNRDGFTETPMAREVSEQGTDQMVTVRSWSTAAKVSDYDITCSVTAKQQRDFKALGLSAFEIALEAAKAQLVQSTNNNILDTMFKLGVENHINIFQATGIQLNLFVDEPTNAGSTIANMNISNTNSFKMEKLDGTDVSADFGTIPNFRTSAQDDGQVDIVRMATSRIALASALIGKLTRIAKGDFIVMGTGLASAIIDAKDNTHAPIQQNLIVGSESLVYGGTLNGMDAYIDPRMDLTDNRVLVGRRGGELDSGLKYFVYDLLSEVETIEGLSMSKKALVSTSYALVAAGHNPQTSYITLICETATGLWS